MKVSSSSQRSMDSEKSTLGCDTHIIWSSKCIPVNKLALERERDHEVLEEMASLN